MAILEIHNGRGRVERIQIGRDGAVLGTNPSCDVVLEGNGVAPVHARIRWQKRRYKVDAGADVDSVEVNGKRSSRRPSTKGTRSAPAAAGSSSSAPRIRPTSPRTTRPGSRPLPGRSGRA